MQTGVNLWPFNEESAEESSQHTLPALFQCLQGQSSGKTSLLICIHIFLVKVCAALRLRQKEFKGLCGCLCMYGSLHVLFLVLRAWKQMSWFKTYSWVSVWVVCVSVFFVVFFLCLSVFCQSHLLLQYICVLSVGAEELVYVWDSSQRWKMTCPNLPAFLPKLSPRSLSLSTPSHLQLVQLPPVFESDGLVKPFPPLTPRWTSSCELLAVSIVNKI